EGGRGGREAPRCGPRREGPVGHRVHRSGRAFGETSHAARSHQGGGRGALPREESRTKPSQPVGTSIAGCGGGDFPMRTLLIASLLTFPLALLAQGQPKAPEQKPQTEQQQQEQKELL